MTQTVKCLLYKHEELRSDHQHPQKDSNTGEAEIGKSLELTLSVNLPESMSSRLSLKKKVRWNPKRWPSG